MKKYLYVMIVTCILATSPAFAGQTPITADMARQYYSNCVAGAERQGTMSSISIQKYCGCTTIYMKDKLTQEDLGDLGKENQAGRNAINKMMVTVNGPCSQYPIHDMLEKKCMSDGTAPSLCSCLSTKIADFLGSHSPMMLYKILQADPNNPDPMAVIYETPEFKSAQQQAAVSCAMGGSGTPDQ